MKVLVGNIDCEAQCGEPGKRTQEMRVDDIPCAHRLLWLADSDDVLVLPAPISHEMIDYVSRFIPVSGVRQVVASTPEEPICLLSEKTLERTDLIERIAESVRAPAQLISYFPDAGATRLARRFGLGCVASSPEIVALNKKSEFRGFAADLGLPITPGAVCRTAKELTTAITRLLDHSGEVVVKQDLAGGGEGNSVLTRFPERREHTGAARSIPVTQDADVRAAGQELFERLTGAGNELIVVEAYLKNDSVVCAELSGSGEVLTWGMMRMDPMFRGFEFPYSFPEADAFIHHSQVLARHCRGYDGRLNIDAFVAPSHGLFFSEVNVRLGGCTHIDVLARRVVGSDYLTSRVILSRNKVRSTLTFGKLIARLPPFDLSTGTGVLVLMEDLARSRAFEYLAMGRTRVEALELEEGIREALGTGTL